MSGDRFCAASIAFETSWELDAMTSSGARFELVEKNRASVAAEILDMVSAARNAGESWALSWTPKLLREEMSEAELYGVFAPSLQGFVFLRPKAERGEITLIAVFPEARGRGVLDLILDKCDALYAGIDLEVRVDNEPARRAYERNGFEVVGRRPRYYSDGVDAVLYSRNSKT